MIIKNAKVGTVENLTAIIFGNGDIGMVVIANEKEGYAGLAMDNIKPRRIGSLEPHNSKNFNELNPDVMINFHNEESIDSVIESLNEVRIQLKKIKDPENKIFVPYGDEWEKEMSKISKKDLINLLKNSYIKTNFKMANKKRPVEFVKSRTLKPIEERRNNKWKGDENYNVTKMKGLFHQWGFEIEEGENEVASLTVGIIEDEAGQIHTPMASDVKFLDKQ